MASFGFCDIPLVWNIGGLVVKPLCSLFQLLHYPLEECGRHRYCETPRATTATTTSWWMRLAFAKVFNRRLHQLFWCGLTALPRSALTECYRRRVPLPLPGFSTRPRSLAWLLANLKKIRRCHLALARGYLFPANTKILLARSVGLEPATF